MWHNLSSKVKSCYNEVYFHRNRNYALSLNSEKFLHIKITTKFNFSKSNFVLVQRVFLHILFSLF